MAYSARTCFVLFFLAFSSALARTKKQKYQPCKELAVYFHDIIYDGSNKENATSAIVAAPDGANLTALAPQSFFGDIVVFDDPITWDNNLLSPPIGRAQGMYVYDNKKILAALLGFTFTLNTTTYQGTISLLGADPTAKAKYIPIVGGSGDFFMHRGVAVATTDDVEGLAYFRLRFDLKFYECW